MTELSDSTRLELHPLRVAPLGDGNYSVIRRGGRREIAVRAVGAEALSRLKAGCSIGETRRWLAEHHATAPESIHLEPLLSLLIKTGMVAAVDGTRIESAKVGLRDYLQFQLRFEVLPRAARTAGRLPLSLARPILRRVYEQKLRGPCQKKVARAGANFERVFPGAGAPQRRRFEKEYFDHLIWNVADLEALRQRPFEQVDEWIESFVRLEGLENLEQARRRGRGVMLAGYHFSSNRLLPVALMRRGVSLLSMGAISIGWGAQATKNLIKTWREKRPSYGELRLVENLDLGSVNALVGELRRGGTVLTLPDVYSLSTFEDAAVAERSQFFGIVRSRFRRATASVRFFDHWIDVNPWGGWLAATARPVILPVLMERGRHRLVCRLGEPFDFSPWDGDSQRERVARVTGELFHRLETEVAKNPAQWFGWHNLDKLNPRPAQGSAQESDKQGLRDGPGVPSEIQAERR